MSLDLPIPGADYGTWAAKVNAALAQLDRRGDDSAAAAAAAQAGAEAARDAAEALIISDLGTTDGQTRALVEAPASQTALALQAAYGTSVLEGLPAKIHGDSYSLDNYAGDVTLNHSARALARLRTLTPTNTGVSGKRCDQVLMEQVVPSWVPNSPVLVALSDVMLNDVDSSNSGYCPASDTAEAFRSLLTYYSSLYLAATTDTGVQYGPGWTNGSSSTAGSYVDIAVTSADVWLVVGYGPTAGQATVKDASGTTLTTVNVGGYVNSFNGVVKVSPSGAGTRTVRVTVTSGTVAVKGYIIPATSPCASVIWYKPGPINDAARSTRLATTAAACAAVAAGYSRVLPVDVDAAWNKATMLTPDGIHLNPLGKKYAADRIEATVRAATAWLSGLNPTPMTTYTPVTPSYVGPGAAAPSAPPAPTVTSSVQLKASWTPAADGGATLTTYDLRYSTDQATWTTVTGIAAKQGYYYIGSGLTQGTTYYVQVRAINSIGTGPWSASGSGAAGAPLTTYADDNFTRADGSIGNVPSGTLAGTAYAAISGTTATITSNRALVATTGSQGGVLLNPAVSTAHVTMTYPAIATGNLPGIILASDSTYQNAYIVFRNSDGNLHLWKRTSGAYGADLATPVAVSAAGATVEVFYNSSTGVIVVKVGGVQVMTYTDSSPYTGTRFGLSGFSSGSKYTHLTIDNALT